MSKKRTKQGGTPARARSETKGRLTADSFINLPARLGLGSDNLLSGSRYPITRYTQDYALLNALYRNDWIASRIVDTPAEDMC